jgi:ABC-2 type transport system permease protein
MLGKILPYVALGLVQATLVVLMGGWLFRVPVVGSVADLYGAIVLLVVASLSLGLVI